MSAGMVRPCPWCEKRHGTHHLCPPAKKVLDAMVARGRSYDMPSLELDDPIDGSALGLGRPGDELVRQIVVQAAIVEAAGVPRAAIILTGRRANGLELPKWLYIGSDEEMGAVSKLVGDMTALAVRRATEARS